MYAVQSPADDANDYHGTAKLKESKEDIDNSTARMFAHVVTFGGENLFLSTDWCMIFF